MSLQYQPIMTLATGELAGFEALVRWHHPLGSSISPREFIPLAEETGLIGELGKWVVHEVCRQLDAWCLMIPKGGVRVSMNLSPRQLHEEQLYYELKDAMAACQMPPSG